VAADAWTPVRDPDPVGVQCAVKEVSIAAAGVTCPPRIEVALHRRLHRAGVLAARLATARPALARKVTTRLLRVANNTMQLIGAGGGSCASGDLTAALGALRDQLNTMQDLRG